MKAKMKKFVKTFIWAIGCIAVASGLGLIALLGFLIAIGFSLSH